MHLCGELIESKLLQDLCGGKKDSKELSFMFSGDNFSGYIAKLGSPLEKECKQICLLMNRRSNKI